MKKIFTLLCVTLFSLTTMANGVKIGDLYYLLDSDNMTASVTYTGSDELTTNDYSGFVTIPDFIPYNEKEYKVIGVEAYAFHDCSITAVEIGHNVTYLGDYAFNGCTSLLTIDIPSSVIQSGYNTFGQCESMYDVYITDLEAWCRIDFGDLASNPLYYAERLYLNNQELEELVIPSSITEIKQHTFINCSSITSVVIPNTVTTIGLGAFENCYNMQTISIGNSVMKIVSGAFEGCSGLTSIDVDAGNTHYASVDGVLFNYAKDTLIQYPIGNSRTEYTIPNFVATIGIDAFYHCHKLTSLTIPNSISTIEEGAFYECDSLVSVTINSNAICSQIYTSSSAIGNIFGSQIIEYIIGDSVTTIGEYAFYGCSGLTSVTIPNSVTTIGYGAFAYCQGLTSVFIGNSVTTIGDVAFNGCSSLISITIPNSVTTIGDVAFNGCSSLISITIPNSVTTIGYGAFAYCQGLTSIDVDTANTHYASIDGVLFNYAKDTLIQYPIGNLHTEYTIPNSVTTIGEFAFYDCSGLTSVTIPNSVTTIGYGAFAYCQGLTSITIPNSVTTIGVDAFFTCNGLTLVTCLAIEPPSLGDDVFDSVPRNIPLYVPAKSVSAYQATEQWNKFIIIPLAVEVEELAPDTTKLIWLPVDSASMYQLHIYAEQVDLDTTLYIEADSLNGGIRIPATMAPRRITLDDIGSIIIIIIEPRSGITKETPFEVTVSTTSTDKIDVGFDLTVLCGAKVIKKEEGGFVFNHPTDTPTNLDNNSSNKYLSAPSIYDLYGHRYSTNQWSSVPAGIYILREGNKAIKVMKPY